MLSDCHRRIEFFLQDLVRLAAEASGRPLEPSQRNALDRALRYFRESGPRHTADEEESLFPRLRSSNDSRLESALAKLDELEAEHVRANAAHVVVDALGRRWLADGILKNDESIRLQSLLRELSELYRDHLALEDSELFPVAAAWLSTEEVIALGREMAKRRGLSPDLVRASSQPRRANQPSGAAGEET